ncbi:MAG: hypothetical protein Q9223_003315 [Gallowayella weberi]
MEPNPKLDRLYQMGQDRSPWRHIVCENDEPENSPKRMHLPNPKYWVLLPGAENGFPWSNTHDQCKLDYQEPSRSGPIQYKDHEGMRLTVLRASRQTYAEANHVLWTTNTFSFPEGVTLQRFMMTRSINQKRLIRSLRFEMEWGCVMEKHYKNVLTMPLVKSLIGLKSLRLNILCEMKAKNWLAVKDRFLMVTRYMEGLRKLSTLPLTSADVTFRLAKYCEEMGRAGLLWQKAHRDQCAADLKKILLNPKGAEVYAEQQRELPKLSRIQMSDEVEFALYDV